MSEFVRKASQDQGEICQNRQKQRSIFAILSVISEQSLGELPDKIQRCGIFACLKQCNGSRINTSSPDFLSAT